MRLYSTPTGSRICQAQAAVLKAEQSQPKLRVVSGD
jgi:hypothetical protein